MRLVWGGGFVMGLMSIRTFGVLSYTGPPRVGVGAAACASKRCEEVIFLYLGQHGFHQQHGHIPSRHVGLASRGQLPGVPRHLACQRLGNIILSGLASSFKMSLTILHV